MKTSWIQGLNEEQTKEMRREFVGSALLRERLRQLIEAKANENRNSTRQRINYESPSWAYMQADALGYERALYEIISLVMSKSD